MKHAKKLICFGVAIATILTASACNFIGTNSSSSSSQNPTPIDYIAKDKPLVEKAMADGELSVLTIGNSFSVDAMEYAYEIADDLGIEVKKEDDCILFYRIYSSVSSSSSNSPPGLEA